jgi:catechol 2,3-dioxygenase-like lactoylglutathione lyase family enzyme
VTARIRYLAILTDDPARLADFYARHLDFETLAQSADGDVALTDGFFNFSFLKRRAALREPHMEEGLHHLGVEVDDLDAIERKYRAFNPNWPLVSEPGGPHFGECRIYDPEGNPVSLSRSGFGIRAGSNRVPRLRHVAYNALWPEGILDFFVAMFGFRELPTSRERRSQGRANRFAGDGATNLAIHPFYNESEGHEPRFGINHVGFLVRDMATKLDAFAREVTVEKRPESRPYAEFRLQDPEGNRFDLSQTKGWEVDIGKWERAA